MTERNADAADLAAEKRELRRRMRTLRSSLPASVVAERSRVAADRVLALPLPVGASVVAVYAGLAAEGELDASWLHQPLRARGITPVYPRVVARQPPQLAFCAVADVSHLAVGTMGVREPSADTPAVTLSSIDVFVVPGVAFDRDGGRLGYGAAFYDVTLAQNPRALRIGYCHPEQLVAHVPCGDHDQRVDLLVTPDTTLSWASRRSSPIPGETQCPRS